MWDVKGRMVSPGPVLRHLGGLISAFSSEVILVHCFGRRAGAWLFVWQPALL